MNGPFVIIGDDIYYEQFHIGTIGKAIPPTVRVALEAVLREYEPDTKEASYTTGYEEGYDIGYDKGHEEGYDAGLSDAAADDDG